MNITKETGDIYRVLALCQALFDIFLFDKFT